MPVRRRRLRRVLQRLLRPPADFASSPFLARQFDPHQLMPDPFADLYSSSHKSSKRQPFQLGLPAGRGAEVVDDRPGSILLQLLVDLPDKLPALVLVGFDRLLLEPLLA